MRRRTLVLPLLLALAACPRSTSDVIEAHRDAAAPVLARLESAIAEIERQPPLAADTLAHEGEPLRFEPHDRATSRGLVVTIDAWRLAEETGDHDGSRVYDDRTWSWPRGAIAGSASVLDRPAEPMREAFEGLARMRHALVIRTTSKTSPRFLEVKYGTVFFDDGKFVGEAWLVDLATGALRGGLIFDAENDPVLMLESEPDAIQASLELDLEFEIRRAARKALKARVPSTVIE